MDNKVVAVFQESQWRIASTVLPSVVCPERPCALTSSSRLPFSKKSKFVCRVMLANVAIHKVSNGSSVTCHAFCVGEMLDRA